MKQGIFKTFGLCLLKLIWFVICLEASLWLLSSFTQIYNIEMLKYAMTLKVKSSNPQVTHEHRPNAKAKLMGVEIALNSLGHRSRSLETPKPKNEKRIYILASSIALGWGVPVDDSFPMVLENRLNREKKPKSGFHYTIINAGIGNYNTFYQVELFKKQVSITNPDLALLQYTLNDAEPNPQAGVSSFDLLKYSLFAGFAYQHFKLLMMKTSGSLANYYSKIYVEGNPSWEKTKNSIKELKAICNARGIPLIVLMVPELQNLSVNNPLSSIYDEIEDTLSEFGIPTVNSFKSIHSVYGEKPIQSRVANDDPHPNGAVHHILADELYEFLIDKTF